MQEKTAGNRDGKAGDLSQTASGVRLYLFPFAGASFYSYNPMLKAFPGTGMDVRPLELPGRGRRVRAGLLSDFHGMAEDLFNEIRPEIRSPFIFFGHSLGALLAYEVILKMMDARCDLPLHLFVSGRRGPGSPSREKGIGSLPREKFYEKVKAYGGTPSQIFAEEDLMAFLEPVLRADFTAAESDGTLPVRTIPLPVTVLNGDRDTVTREEYLRWQDITSESFGAEVFSGGHFFIFDHGASIGRLIASACHNACCSLKGRAY